MNPKGLTIIESMIAMVILGLISLGISQFYQYTIYKNESVEQRSVANAMAEDYLELLKLQTLSPETELQYDKHRIINGDTLYYHFVPDLEDVDKPAQGVLYILCKEDTLLQMKTVFLKEANYEP